MNKRIIVRFVDRSADIVAMKDLKENDRFIIIEDETNVIENKVFVAESNGYVNAKGIGEVAVE